MTGEYVPTADIINLTHQQDLECQECINGRERAEFDAHAEEIRQLLADLDKRDEETWDSIEEQEGDDTVQP